MKRQDLRAEYKWVRDAMVGQHYSERRPLPPRKRSKLNLANFLGIVLVGVSLAFIALAMFK